LKERIEFFRPWSVTTPSVAIWAELRFTLPQPEHLDQLAPKEQMMDYADNKFFRENFHNFISIFWKN